MTPTPKTPASTQAQSAPAPSTEATVAGLQTQRDGLTSEEAARRLARYGPNALAEHREGPLRKLLGYFWGPIPWMIEAAALLSALVRHWADLAIILVLLVFNALVEFWQGYQAGNAIEQLRRTLALKAKVRRDGRWQEIEARELVPGDIVRVRLGDLIPADLELIEGDYLSLDQSALTGESLPVERHVGEAAYSGSVARQGEMVGAVTATGMQTFFGKTAHLVAEAGSVSHFQRAVLAIGDYLIYLALGLVAILVLVGLHRHWPLLELAQFALILTVASIPVAMPAVLSVTMAVGALVLSRVKAIVSRLESIEELAGMDVLCSDKTGTLTQNRLTLGDPVRFSAADDGDLILAAALASKEEDGDPIDLAVLRGVRDPEGLTRYHQDGFTPFDPVGKRTEATLHDLAGTRFQVTKGAPQVVAALCPLAEEERNRVSRVVDDLATKGYRTLAVARRDDGADWTLLGILPLFDPPREDAAETLAQASRHGIRVKMVTGDNQAIAVEIAGRLGLGRSILPADRLDLGEGAGEAQGLRPRIEEADGFSQVFPEHKYRIVKALQSDGHLVGMTGDGVNDAPALKQADVGIAVSGATDAARSAADLVLTAPGLGVIIRAVEEARRIFARMNAYAIYRITETIRIMIFMVLAMVIYDFYPITAVMIILLAVLNDLPIMAIAKDNTRLDPAPSRWQLRPVLTIASVLGAVGVLETFLLLVIAESWLGLPQALLQSMIFLKLVVAGHLTLLVARTRGPFWAQPFPAPLLLGAILATQAAAVLIVGFGLFMTPLPWTYIGLVWGYCLAWLLVEDFAKRLVYAHLEVSTPRHRRFLDLARRPLSAHGSRSRR